MNLIPLVRHFLVCENVEVRPGNAHATLEHVYHAVRPIPGDAFPLRHEHTHLYAVLTDGRGRHTFAVELAFGVGPAEQIIGTSAAFERDLGADPLLVHGLPIKLPPIRFDQPGQYEFRLLCDGRAIAREPIDVRAAR